MRFPRFHYGVAIALGLGMLCMSSVPVFADGPVNIDVGDCDGLQDMNNNLSANYTLTADIDCDGVDFTPIGPALISPFIGTFDGNGHTISNLSIDNGTDSYSGLFGNTTSSELREFRIVGATVTGGLHSAIAVGRASNATITQVGVEDFHLTSSDNNAGGLVGYSTVTTISQSFASSGVVVATSESYVGGFAGTFERGTYEDISVNSVTVTGDTSVGGIAGRFYSFDGNAILTDAYANADITGTTEVGGAFGSLNDDIGRTCSITNVFSVGDVSGTTSVGGLVGQNDSFCSIVNSAYNNTAGNPSSCVGTNNNSGGTSCSSLNNNESYFYDADNAPLTSWDFSGTWSEILGALPLLSWTNPSGTGDNSSLNSSTTGGAAAHRRIRKRYAEIASGCGAHLHNSATTPSLSDVGIFVPEEVSSTSQITHIVSDNLEEPVPLSRSTMRLRRRIAKIDDTPPALVQTGHVESNIEDEELTVFEQRVCKRVLNRFTGVALERVNERLKNRLEFSCVE